MSWESTGGKMNQGRFFVKGAAKDPAKIMEEYAGTEVGCHGVSGRMCFGGRLGQGTGPWKLVDKANCVLSNDKGGCLGGAIKC